MMELPAGRMSAPLEAGSVFRGRYRIESVLGTGASGVVYAAHVEPPPSGAAPAPVADGPAPGERVALKLLHRNLARHEQIARRFHREARILSRLSGPNLARVFEFGASDDGQLFMVLALVDGVSLDQLISAEGIQPERAARLTIQICGALEAAHAAGVVHRDLKPLNVMVERAGEADERARVLDFGMAKIVRGDLRESVNILTQQNMVLGTPEYMAPEQARGDEVDERVDIYAAGVMLYEMLTGTVPFQSNTPIGTMTAHLMEQPESPSKRAPARGIAPALESIALHALAKRPDERYQSAHDLAVALGRALESPLDVRSTAPPPMSSDGEFGTRDTDPALHYTASLRKTELALEPVNSGPPGEEPPSKAWVAIALAAAVFGIVLGVLMSLLGAR